MIKLIARSYFPLSTYTPRAKDSFSKAFGGS